MNFGAVLCVLFMQLGHGRKFIQNGQGVRINMAADTLHFNYVIEETYRLLATEQPQNVSHVLEDALCVANFLISDVAFSVAYSPAADPDNITVFCDFGAVPEHQALTTYKNLLETNFHFPNSRSPTFCLNPENGHVLFVFVIELLELAPETLKNILNELAVQAGDWRLTVASPRPYGLAR